MNKKLAYVVLAIVIVAAGTFVYTRLRYGRLTLPPQYRKEQSAGKQTQPGKSGQLAHVAVIIEENKPEGSVIGSPAAPYINSLARTYARADHYYAVTNPSLPNYIALTSGTTAGITNDCNPPGSVCRANVTNVADRLRQAGKTWREYAESMPAPCYSANSGEYAVKHNPFMYYPDITSDKSRCKTHVVPYDRLASDLLSAATTPDFAFITPNLCNDMHDCSVSAGDDWLAREVPKILQSPAFTRQRSLLVIVWDECNAVNNNVPVVFAGPAARKGYVSSVYYSHYSLLHTIETGLGLQPLTQNDAQAPLMTDMLR